MTKNKNDKSNHRAERNYRDLEEAVLTFQLLICDWHGHEKSDPNDDAIHHLDGLEREQGVERILSGAHRALSDYEQVLRNREE